VRAAGFWVLGVAALFLTLTGTTMRFLRVIALLLPLVMMLAFSKFFYPIEGPYAASVCYTLICLVTLWNLLLFHLVELRCEKLEEQLNALKNLSTQRSVSSLSEANASRQFQRST
jgi:hypothetical protein